jgi:hypothetical protein
MEKLMTALQEEGPEKVLQRAYENREFALNGLKELARSAANGLAVNPEDVARYVQAGLEASDTLIGMLQHDLVLAAEGITRQRKGLVLNNVGLSALVELLSQKGVLTEAEFMESWEKKWTAEATPQPAEEGN